MSGTVTVTEDVIHTFETSPPRGAKGDPGDAVVPSSSSITYIDGEVTRIDRADGSFLAINREDGEVVSTYDGTYTQTFIRTDGIITGIIVT